MIINNLFRRCHFHFSFTLLDHRKMHTSRWVHTEWEMTCSKKRKKKNLLKKQCKQICFILECDQRTTEHTEQWVLLNINRLNWRALCLMALDTYRCCRCCGIFFFSSTFKSYADFVVANVSIAVHFDLHLRFLFASICFLCLYVECIRIVWIHTTFHFGHLNVCGVRTTTKTTAAVERTNFKQLKRRGI